MGNDKKFSIILGMNIRNQREFKGYTREKLAELADTTDNYIYQIETGRTNVSAIILYRISEALEVTTDYLINGEEATIKSTKIYEKLESLSVEKYQEIEEIIYRIINISSHEMEG